MAGLFFRFGLRLAPQRGCQGVLIKIANWEQVVCVGVLFVQQGVREILFNVVEPFKFIVVQIAIVYEVDNLRVGASSMNEHEERSSPSLPDSMAIAALLSSTSLADVVSLSHMVVLVVCRSFLAMALLIVKQALSACT